MSIRDAKGSIVDLIPIENVIISVFDKTNLESLIPELINLNPSVRFMSTGGTHKKIKEMLGKDAERYLMEIAQYTDFPEMEGGLVKTLHPKIHAGILGERNNPEHQLYLENELNNAVYIDLVVGNLYPFGEIVKKIERGDIDTATGKKFNFESARGNIDIGGPSMLRGAAKNFLSCAALCDPADYEAFLKEVKDKHGCTSFEQRLGLMPKVFEMTGNYDTSIAKYMVENAKNPEAIKAIYHIIQGGPILNIGGSSLDIR